MQDYLRAKAFYDSLYFNGFSSPPYSQPTGLLAYLDSPDSVPEKDVDRMHIRDNLKMATVSQQTPLHIFVKLNRRVKQCLFLLFLLPVGSAESQQGARVAADCR